MVISSVFTDHLSQAVRLPAELRLPEGVTRVQVRAVGPDRVIEPVKQTWDSFFLQTPRASDDFMP